METKIFDAAFKDFRGAIEAAAQPVRNYNRTSEKPTYKPENARFKLVVWFKDGNTRYYYSFDTKSNNKELIVDEFEGLKKLIRLVDSYKDKFKNAIIYATIEPDKSVKSNFNCEVMRYNMYNAIKTNQYATFKNVEKNVIFDFERMKYLNKLKIE